MPAARLVAPLLGLCLLLTACARPGIERILLVCIERLPAEGVGAYGANPSLTPRLDRLAAEGVRFEVVIAPSLEDRAGHASLLTALDPPRHGVRGDAAEIPAELPTLPDVMERRGFHSRALDSVDAATAWLAEAPPRFFLTLHLGRREGGAPQTRAEIARLDAELGRLLDALEASPARGKRLLVVTSARASGQDEGQALRDTALRVPLILAGIGLPRGRVVAVPVRLVDVAPTILTLGRLPGIQGADGRSLMPLVTGKSIPWPYAYAESPGGLPPLALRTPDYKYIRANPSALYDLRADPSERHDIAPKQPDRVDRLEALLAARVARAAQ